MQDAFQLQDKVALVTGGASGIGEATSRELTRAGAHVLIADLNLKAAQALVDDLGAGEALALDVTDSKAVGRAFEGISTLDILVNNAGVGSVGDLLHTPEDEFDRLMRVNVRSVYLVTRAALPKLLERRGSIVNIGSVAGLVGVKQRFAYCASKGAVIALTRQIAVD